MDAAKQHSPDLLCAEILAEAKRESEVILQRAKTEAEAILAAASAAAEKIRRERREQAQAEAARRKELILATVAVEAGRLRSARVEALLESVREEIRRQLSARNFDARETIVALAAEAIRQMPGNNFVLKISAVDCVAFGDELAGEIAQRVGRSPLNLAISADATVTGGGIIIQTADGFQIWDNRLLTRLDRLWPELRTQIAIRASLVDENNSTGGGA
jgi:vacuolar-type H+-ATPase subunit E/Vma4